jgi:hypothetical protein
MVFGDNVAGRVLARVMPSRRVIVAMLVTLAITQGGCTRDDPLASLEAAVQQLQDDLEAKRTGAVMNRLAPAFQAQGELDRSWAERALLLRFSQHAKVNIIALTRSSHLAPNSQTLGFTQAQVVLTGAQDLVPEQATSYTISLQWQRDGSQWKLLSLVWE